MGVEPSAQARRGPQDWFTRTRTASGGGSTSPTPEYGAAG
jgi:hypothetical protein